MVSLADTGVCAGSAAMTGGSVVAGTGIVGGFAGEDVHPENQPSVRRGGWHDPERAERRGAADLARLYMMGQVRLARKVSSIQHFLNDISTFLTSIVQRKPRSSGDAARRRCQAVSSCEFKSLSANSSANHLSMANRVTVLFIGSNHCFEVEIIASHSSTACESKCVWRKSETGRLKRQSNERGCISFLHRL